MRRYNWRFLIIGMLLSVLIFAASLALFPDWGNELRMVVVLAVLAITAGFGFLANFRQAVEVEDERRADSGDGAGRTIETGGGALVDDPHSTEDYQALRQSYLNILFETVGALQLSGIDPKAAGENNDSISLSAVYTAFLTTSSDQTIIIRQTGEEQRESAKSTPLSALEMLNRSNRLVLLGDPGSGRSTFVNFVALCLAGEALNHPKINLSLLTAPRLRDEEDRRPFGKQEEPRPQPDERPRRRQIAHLP